VFVADEREVRTEFDVEQPEDIRGSSTDIPVLTGDDDVPRQPAPPLDPFTPEPGPRDGERKAFGIMRLAWIPLLIVIAIVLFAALR
jgi:hypothetical protein